MKKKRVFIYVRVSTQEQAREGYSIGEQIERLKKYCDAMDWIVVKIYTDAGHSGANMERPALQQMIKAVKAGKADSIVVYKLDRLSRSQKDTLTLIEDILLANNTDFVSMNENFDTSTSFGRAMIGILAVFAQLEREQIRERLQMGKYARAKLGKFSGSPNVPTGYDYIDGLFVPHEFEKISVAEAFKLAATGMNPYAIARELNERGYNRRSGKWNDKNVRRTLRHKSYIGYMKYNDEWFKAEHEPLVSDDLFEKVQDILDRKKELHQKKNMRAGKATSYLGGYLHCAHCTAKYSKNTARTKKKNGDGYYTYEKFLCNSRQSRCKHLIKDKTCKNKTWNVSDLTDAVFEQIKQLGLDPEYMNTLQETAPEDTRPAAIRKEIQSLENQISKLMDLYAVSDMPVDALQEKLNALNDKKTKLEAELIDIAKENEKKLSQTQAHEIAKSFSVILDRGDFDEIRSVIADLIEKVVIDNDTIDIHWTFV